MSVIVKEVVTKRDRRIFVNFLYKIYRNNKFWVAPLRSDEKKLFDPKKNPCFEIAKWKMWIAYKNGKCVGRVLGLIIPAWIEKTGEKLARFTRIEFIDDFEVSQALFDTVKSWAKAEGMDGIVGPLGFSNLDQSALLIEGHNWLPSIASNYQWDYYQKHFDRFGFVKETDWVEFRITFPDVLPEKSFTVADLLKTRYMLRIHEFKTLEELIPFKTELEHLYNDAFKDLYGTYPLPDKVLNYFFDKYFPNLNPRYVKLVLDTKDNMIGFIISMPSLSRALQKARGRLFPFGFIHVLRAMKNNNEMDLMLTGARHDMQRKGISALLMNELWKTANADGIKYVETTGMIEDNHIAIQLWKSFEHIQHKRKRCYRMNF